MRGSGRAREERRGRGEQDERLAPSAALRGSESSY